MRSIKQFSFVYGGLLILELIFASVPSLNFYHYFTKPLIVILLLIYSWSFVMHKKPRNLLTMALLFSLGGDVLLMFTDMYESFFILGLISFLLAHIFYCFLFAKDRNKRVNPLKILIPLFLYGFCLLFILGKSLGEMKIPVFVYMAVIVCMASLAFLRKSNVSAISFQLVFIGALLFMLSDSLIAINKFHSAIPYSALWIMSTYGISQFLIVTGILKNETGA